MPNEKFPLLQNVPVKRKKAQPLSSRNWMLLALGVLLFLSNSTKLAVAIPLGQNVRRTTRLDDDTTSANDFYSAIVTGVQTISDHQDPLPVLPLGLTELEVDKKAIGKIRSSKTEKINTLMISGNSFEVFKILDSYLEKKEIDWNVILSITKTLHLHREYIKDYKTYIEKVEQIFALPGSIYLDAYGKVSEAYLKSDTLLALIYFSMKKPDYETTINILVKRKKEAVNIRRELVTVLLSIRGMKHFLQIGDNQKADLITLTLNNIGAFLYDLVGTNATRSANDNSYTFFPKKENDALDFLEKILLLLKIYKTNDFFSNRRGGYFC